MATRYIGVAANDGPQVIGSDVVGAASGGTLAGSQILQVVFDDSVFGSTQEAKQRFLAQLDIIRNEVAIAKEWPITTSS